MSVKMEDYDDEPVIIENSLDVDVQKCLPLETMMSVEQASQGRNEDHYVTQLVYESQDVSSPHSSRITSLKNNSNIQKSINNAEEIEYRFPSKRRRSSSILVNNPMGMRDQEYENSASVIYDYDTEYDAASVISDDSYTGDQHRMLTDVLGYCQAMYDMVQKLDKKMDLLQRKVSDMHYVRIRPRPSALHPKITHSSLQGKMRLHKLNQRVPNSHLSPSLQRHQSPLRMKLERNVRLQPSSSFTPVHSVEQQRRQSPPLPTIVSTHSLQPSYSVTEVPHNPVQNVVAKSMCVSSPIVSASMASPSIRAATSEASLKEVNLPLKTSSASHDESIIISEEQPSSSVPSNSSYEFVGDPSRNIKVPGNSLMKARQKTKPKYAARYLFRIVFPKETLIDNVQGISSLDVNKVSAIREFLASAFSQCDLGEYGKDWKTCITNINSMIRCLQSEARKATSKSCSNPAVSQTSDSICVDSDANEDEEVGTSAEAPPISQKPCNTPSSKQANQQGEDNEPEPIALGSSAKKPPFDPLEHFGETWRNVKLPFSVIYIGKGKSRPELSARYLVRHLFTEDVLVKSNVYGNAERGVLPLDSNKISALRDFLQTNYPTFNLKETGYDWKACVAAINSTIRSLRHDQKKASIQLKKRFTHHAADLEQFEA
ncbi:BEN domain-containing protein 2 [Pelodytes ibericus]